MNDLQSSQLTKFNARDITFSNWEVRKESYNLLQRDVAHHHDVLSTLTAAGYQGPIACAGNPNYPVASAANWWWMVSTAGLIGGGSGVRVEVGDFIFSLGVSPGGTHAAVGHLYQISQVNIDVATVAEIRAGLSATDYLSPLHWATLLNAGSPTTAMSTATILNIAGGTTEQIKLTSIAAQKALTIASTLQTTHAITGTMTVADTSVAFMDVTMSLSTAFTTAKALAGTNFSITTSATDVDGSSFTGYNVTLTGTALSKSDVHGFRVVHTGTYNGVLVNPAEQNVIGFQVAPTACTLNATETNYYGFNIDLTGLTVTSAKDVYGIRVVGVAGMDAAAYMINATTDTAIILNSVAAIDISMATASSLAINVLADTVNANNSKRGYYISRDLTGDLTVDRTVNLFAGTIYQNVVNSTTGDFDASDTADTSGCLNLISAHTVSAGSAKTGADLFRGTNLNLNVSAITGADAFALLDTTARAINILYDVTRGAGSTLNYNATDIAKIDWNVSNGVVINGAAVPGAYLTGMYIDGRGFVPGATLGASTIITGHFVDWTDTILNDANANLYGYKAIMPYSNNNTTNAINSAFIAVLSTNTNIVNKNSGYTCWNDASNTTNGAPVTVSGYGFEYLSTLRANQAVGGAITTKDTNPVINLAITTDATNAADAVNITTGFISMSVTPGGAGTTALYGNMVSLTTAGTTDAQTFRGYYLNASNILLTTSNFFGFDIDTTGVINTSSDACYGGRISVAATADGALYTTDGTRILTLCGSAAHLSSTATMITNMPVTAPGVGFDTAGGVLYVPHGKKGVSGMILQEIFIDLGTAVVSGSGVDGDAIGEAAGGAAHIGQITVALNGSIQAIEVICVEAPTIGTADINLYSNASGALVYGDALGGGTLLVDAGGAWTLGMIKAAANLPAANDYLYLGEGDAAGAGAYATGKFIIRIYGS